MRKQMLVTVMEPELFCHLKALRRWNGDWYNATSHNLPLIMAFNVQ